MNVITVTPLSRSKLAESLSYFTSSNVPIGAIVTIPVRKKIIHGIVSETRPAEDIKAEIKSAPFEIRRLGKVRATAFFPSPFMEACKRLAHYYVGNLGSVIDALTADVLLDNVNKIDSPGTPQGSALSRRLKLEASTYAVQGDDDDRMSSWRTLIRQEFARKKSVAFYVPTVEDAENLCAMLTKGIEEYIFVLHSDVPRKKVTELWKKIARENHPVVIIATASYVLLPRADIDTLIIERENSRGWVSQKAPYLDLRHALETIAHLSGQIVHRADSMLRTETLKRLDDEEISRGSPFKWRSISLATDTLINMTSKPARDMRLMARQEIAETADQVNGNSNGKKTFHVLSAELEDLIRNNRDESTHLFIYVARRGMAAITVCDDCQNIVLCSNCGAPVVLHSSKENDRNFFMCHVCGERRDTDETCKNCGSWRLTALGIGIERVENEIKEKFSGVDIIKVDVDSTPTDKQVNEALNRFKSRPGSILLGTELAFSRLRDKIDHSAIASLDSLFALPDFRIPEKIMYTLVRLRALSTKSILVQTRRPQEKVFEYALKGNLTDFYHSTLDERKRFKYPPFSTLIKISAEGRKELIAQTMAEIKKLIEPHDMDIFPAFTSTGRGTSVIHGLIRIEPFQWPDSQLVAKLRTLPPSVSVRVGPESLL